LEIESETSVSKNWCKVGQPSTPAKGKKVQKVTLAAPDKPLQWRSNRSEGLLWPLEPRLKFSETARQNGHFPNGQMPSHCCAAV
jgi:hypothetical protein